MEKNLNVDHLHQENSFSPEQKIINKKILSNASTMSIDQGITSKLSLNKISSHSQYHDLSNFHSSKLFIRF